MGPIRVGWRAACRATFLLLACAAFPATAAAATSSIALDAPDNGNPPLVAYAPTDGYTYVAWSAPDNQNGGNGVDLCVLAPDATSCAGGGPVLLTDTNTGALGTNTSNTVGLGGLVILPSSGEVVVLGTPVSTGTVAWVSPPGGAAFLTGDNGLANEGNFISPVSLYYTTNNAVAISSTDVGLFDSYDHSYSYFSDSPAGGPETPSTLAQDPCPTDPSAGDEGNANNCGQFDDQGDTVGPVIAAEPAPAPAAAGTEIVVGAGANVSSNEATPSGCVNDAATGYGVDVGTTGASGTLNSQGLQPNGFGLLACAAEYPTLASGGKDGIGVLEVEGSGVSGAGSSYTLDWRPFDATATGGSFGGPVQVAPVDDAPDDLDVSEDSGTGVYALFEQGGLYVAYSPNGGANWDAPVLVPPPANGEISNPTIAGVADGIVEVAFENNPGTGEQTFLQPVDAIPPTPTALTTTQTSGSTTGSDITIPAGTIGESDRATITGTSAADATGTVDFALYDNSSCTGTAAFAGSATATAGVASIADDASAGLAPGTYYWKAAYLGNAYNAASVSACGSEVLTVTDPATAPSSATTTGSTVSVTISCASACTVTVTIETTSGGAADIARAGEKSKTVTLGTAKFSLKKGGKDKLKLKLNKTGKSLLKKDHDKLKATILLTTKTAHGTFKSSGKLNIKK